MASPRTGHHSGRLAAISKDLGTFVYDGLGVSVEHSPTPLKSGKKDPVFDERGAPVIDRDGNQMFETPGRIRKDSNGNVILGGPPKEERVVMTSRTVFGVEFPAGKPVVVTDLALAQKLRCLHGFSEIVKAPEDPAADLTTIDGLLMLSKSELVEMAKAKNIDVAGLNKPELAEAILA